MKPDLSFLEDISHKLSQVVPEGAKNIKNDLQENFKAILQASLAKLDVVTREEFDNQKILLAKAQAQLAALEKKLADLEQHKK